MKKTITILAAILLLMFHLHAQVEPNAGNWKTWFISSGKDYRLPAPGSVKAELATVMQQQEKLDDAGRQQIYFWNAGAPGYRWHEMMNKLWQTDTGRQGALANMLLGAAIYDATVAAWDTKYAYQRTRPFMADKKIKMLIPKPESPSYPCEHSVAAGVAVAVFSHFYPHLADSVSRMAERAMTSRVAAGVVFPSDAAAGFALGKKIALYEIEQTKEYINRTEWDGKMPVGQQYWRGKKPMYPMAGKSKTVVLDSSSQFRPGPPPDFAKDMAEMKAFKQTFRSQANAFYYASQNSSDDMLNRKMFEYNLHLNPPRAARVYAAMAIASYDGFAACWDAKYAYWGTRPDQYDTTYKALLPTPPFPGYPSGHAMMGGLFGDLLTYFFPADKAYFRQRAKDGAESRFQGGIHFRTDNEVGLALGQKIAAAIVERIAQDGADQMLPAVRKEKSPQANDQKTAKNFK